ncbi:MAG: glucosamine inositolphosphorylceramide transferase family protein [bacterium]
MLIKTNNHLFLFFEELVNGKGELAVSKINPDTMKLEDSSKTILTRATHLSYPFVFSVNNAWYMIPENSASGQLAIYQSEEFPYKWKTFRVVFDNEEWLDTTPLYYNGKWWIFSTKKPVDYASSYQELHLFFCDDILFDQWIPHPENPVVSDIRKARPGGALFWHDEKLYRPAQNCYNRYGGSLFLCEVQELSEYKYREKVIKELKFPWYKKMSSFHTIAVYKDNVVGDCNF